MYAAKHLNLATLHGSKLSISKYILTEPTDHVFTRLHIKSCSIFKWVPKLQDLIVAMYYMRNATTYERIQSFLLSKYWSCSERFSVTAYKIRSLDVIENINYKLIIYLEFYSSFSTNLLLLSFQTSWLHKTWLEL